MITSPKQKAAGTKLSPARIRQLSALAKRIDTEEKPAIRAKGREVFKRHEMIRELVDVLKAHRLRAGLSLSELATRTGIAKPNLSRLENNRSASPTLETLQRYALALGKKLRVQLN